MSEKTFIHYLAESLKEYKYRLKFAYPVDDSHMDKLESCLEKYGVRSVESFKKTIFQEHPLDFSNVENTEVYITDVVLEYPASRDQLILQISEKLSIDPKYVVAMTDNDPLEQAAQLKLEREDPERDYIPALGSEDEVTLEEPIYGDVYNRAYLEALRDTAAEEKEALKQGKVDFESPLNPDQIEDEKPKEKELKADTGAVIHGNNKLNVEKKNWS